MVPSPPSMKSGYSPPAIMVPTASAAVWPVSQVSLTLAPVFSAISCWISLSSLISEPGTAKKASNSLISPLPAAAALPPSAVSPVPPAASPPPPQPTSVVAARVAASKAAAILFFFMCGCPPFFCFAPGIVQVVHNPSTPAQISDTFILQVIHTFFTGKTIEKDRTNYDSLNACHNLPGPCVFGSRAGVPRLFAEAGGRAPARSDETG